MKKILFLILITIVLTLSNCTKEVVAPSQDLPYGYYNLTISKGEFKWGIGYRSEIISTIGKVEKFTGVFGDIDNLENTIGILLDTANNHLVMAKSCIDGSPQFRYLTYYHPTVDEQGNLDFPEFLCHPYYSFTSFQGSLLNNDSIYFDVVIGDDIGGTSYKIFGEKIN